MSHCMIMVGVGRSGTSAIAGTLARSRTIFDEDVQMLDLLPGDRGNPKGFFEDKQVINLNERILRDQNRWVLSCRPVDTDLILKTTRYDEEARAIMRKYAAPFFCLKDPRLSLTLPIFLRAARYMGHYVSVLHVRRERKAIRASLKARDSITDRNATTTINNYERTLRLWKATHTIGILAWQEISFEEFMLDPAATLQSKYRGIVVNVDKDFLGIE